MTQGTPVQKQLLAELSFSQQSFIGSSLYRAQIEGVEIHFNYPKPSHVASYESALNAVVSFDCEYSQLFLPSSQIKACALTHELNPIFHLVFIRCLDALFQLESSRCAVPPEALEQCHCNSLTEHEPVLPTRSGSP